MPDPDTARALLAALQPNTVEAQLQRTLETAERAWTDRTWPDQETGRTFTTEERRKAAAGGAALPDGSYPIFNQEDMNNADRSIGRGGASADTIKAHIRKRAKALGLKLPDSMMSSKSGY